MVARVGKRRALKKLFNSTGFGDKKQVQSHLFCKYLAVCQIKRLVCFLGKNQTNLLLQVGTDVDKSVKAKFADFTIQ